MQADFNSRFIGDGDAIHHLVAVIESIVFLLQYNLEYIKQLNPSLQHIVIGGGLARFDTFCQRLADLGLAVSRPAQTETTSQGLAFLLDQDPGIDHDLKYQAPLENSATFKPQDNPMLKQRYQEWRKIMTLQLKND
jgi:glycerol kinase